MFSFNRDQKDSFSVLFYRYQGGTMCALKLPWVGKLHYRNQTAEDLGGEFSEAMLFSQQVKMLLLDITLIEFHFSTRWNRFRSSGTYDARNLVFGKESRLAVPDGNDPARSTTTTSDGRVFTLTYGTLYRVRPRWGYRRRVKDGWILEEQDTGQEPLLSPNEPMVVDSPGKVEDLVRTLNGLGDDVRTSADYFQSREGKPM